MTTDSFFAILCGSLIGLLFGLAIAFAGYRLFLVLLPIWGFFYGFVLGAQAIQALLGEAFLATITSWVVGFVVAAVFAILSYLFWLFAVAIVAGSLGYGAAVGVLLAIGLDFGLIVWLAGLAAAVVLIIVTFRFNLQKYVVELATGFGGAAVIVGVFLFLFGGLPASQLIQNPVKLVLQNSPFWMIVFLVLGIVGFVAQIRSDRNFEVNTYNRLSGTA